MLHMRKGKHIPIKCQHAISSGHWLEGVPVTVLLKYSFTNAAVRYGGGMRLF